MALARHHQDVAIGTATVAGAPATTTTLGLSSFGAGQQEKAWDKQVESSHDWPIVKEGLTNHGI
jgi:hypothetical protein